MVIAMILAHLVGDYVLQWDALAQMKARSMKGVLIHGAIITAVTWLFALPFGRDWWQGVLFISGTHILIDAAQVNFKPSIPPVLRFSIDQALHFMMMFTALIVGGYLTVGSIWPDLVAEAMAMPWLAAVTLYAFVTMPAWVLLKFVVYAVVDHSAPDFPAKPSKFVGIAERVLITTLVALGQGLLIPLVTLPRLVTAWPQAKQHELDRVYMTEFLASAGLAIVAGLGVRLLPL